jgi:DNA-binding CsgD family transcriptional regulator/PAS domain-containing protein
MRGDNLLATIEAIHAAGLDESLWPQALAATARTVGGNAATLEVFGKQTLRPTQMYSFGVPRHEEIAYLAQLAETNIRLPFVVEQKLDEILWDFKILDEGAMRCSPFYADFLARMDMRYFVSGILHKTAEEFAAVCVHRSAKMGHIQRDGIATLRALVPHVRQAFDVARRLKRSGDARDQLERTLDWLADGVALIRANGAVVYANDSLQAMARRNDGVHLRKHGLELADPVAQQKFDDAPTAVLRLKIGELRHTPVADFVAARSPPGQPYLVSVRPLIAAAARARASPYAAAIVFVRDPLTSGSVATDTLRELFGLTEAEAVLAQALQSGMTLSEYARRRALSLNTVYTHLRRLREKTGCSRMPELIRKLNELRVPLRRY